MECEVLTSSKSIAEAAMSLEDEGDEIARCELNDKSKKPSITERNDNQLTTTRSLIDEPQAATSSADGNGEKLEGSESDKSSANMPITELGDEQVIPTPPPPPPVKSLYLDKVDEINKRILGHRKHQVNQVKKGAKLCHREVDLWGDNFIRAS